MSFYNERIHSRQVTTDNAVIVVAENEMRQLLPQYTYCIQLGLLNTLRNPERGPVGNTVHSGVTLTV